MKVTSIRLETTRFIADPVLHAEFPLVDFTGTNPYILTAATGLDSEEIIPKYYANSPTLEIPYYKMVMPKRTVVLLVKINPNFTLGESTSDLRDALYKVIGYTHQGTIEMVFMDGASKKAYLTGNITKLETNLFSNDTSVKITFECKNPVLKSYTQVNTLLDSLPYGSWTDGLSTAPHGHLTTVVFSGAVLGMGSNVGFSIENPDAPVLFAIPGANVGSWVTSYGEFRIKNFDFQADDILSISSLEDNRYVFVRRQLSEVVGDYQDTNLADKVVPGSIWPTMVPGLNKMDFPDSGNISSVNVTYNYCYWGV